MTSAEIKETIKYHIENNMLLTVERSIVAENDVIIGFPVRLTERFFVMSVINDFYHEGYAIVNTEDITDAYSKESDAFYEKICKAEGLNNTDLPKCLRNMSDYQQLFKGLAEYDGLIAVQCKEQYERGTFFLGKIESVTNDSVKLLEVGTDGVWDTEAETIFFDEIIQISFGDNYSKTYYKYVRK